VKGWLFSVTYERPSEYELLLTPSIQGGLLLLGSLGVAPDANYNVVKESNPQIEKKKLEQGAVKNYSGPRGG